MSNANKPAKAQKQEKTSKLKSAFQYATAFMFGLTGDNINLGFQQGGLTYDYAKAYVGSKRKPQL